MEKMKILNVLFLLLTLFFLAGCASKDTPDEILEDTKNQQAKYQKISPEAAKEMINDQSIVLDVRTQEEYDMGHIEGATLVPVDSILADQLDKLPDKDQVILVYCRSGNRSEIASKHLVEKGYTQVYDFGGINDWPYEIVK